MATIMVHATPAGAGEVVARLEDLRDAGWAIDWYVLNTDDDEEE